MSGYNNRSEPLFIYIFEPRLVHARVPTQLKIKINGKVTNDREMLKPKLTFFQNCNRLSFY